jgi:hypothetical protein
MCQFEYLQRKILPETAMQDDINHKVLSEESTIVVFIMSKVACECRGYHIFFKQTYVNNYLQERNNMGKILISELLFGVDEVYLHYVSLHRQKRG